MPVQLSSKEGQPETAVKARKIPFMAAVLIIGHYKTFLHFSRLPLKPEVNISIEKSTEHVQTFKKIISLE